MRGFSRRSGVRMALVVSALSVASLLTVGPARAEDPSGSGVASDGPVRPALLSYGRGKSTRCFATGFLADADTETNINVERTLTPVRLGEAALFKHPFAVLSGEGMFTLTEKQRRNLRRYIEGGGFVLASPGCASEPWGASFRREMGRLFPDVELKPLDTDHPLFSAVREVDEFVTQDGQKGVPIYGLEVGGRLAAVFAPNGLNGTEAAGEGCACCCGHEIRNARALKLNILAYALTH